MVDVVRGRLVMARWMARRGSLSGSVGGLTWLGDGSMQSDAKKCDMYVRLARLRHMHVHAGLICMLACMAFGLACVIFMVL